MRLWTLKEGSGYLIWYNELIYMRILSNKGQDIYIRMSDIPAHDG
ncbi:hypothetical protein HanPI659440_Chr02g0042961 [Helianthus annuus]|nr:hypothetical protein HanPI659440_Chr02g0042961 [Helianthus annuus]